MKLRDAVMTSLSLGQWVYGKSRKTPLERVRSLGLMLRYGMKYRMTSRRKEKQIVNISKLVDDWIEAIVGMCVAHDKDSYDAHDAKADELLGPILTAPIKDVREFYFELAKRMKEDKRVPMLVWMGFEAWGRVIVENAPDQGIKRLKNKLASEIADIVEEPIRDQIPKAIERALRWRDPETLKEMKEVLKSGAKPKLVGRESCLFLEAKKNGKKMSVML